jgi:hypothetical protein
MGQTDASIVQLVLPELQPGFCEPVSAVAWVAIAYARVCLTCAGRSLPRDRVTSLRSIMDCDFGEVRGLEARLSRP